MTARRTVALRIGSTGLDAIDALAAELGRDRSQVMRLLLALGHQQWQGMTPTQRKVILAGHRLIDQG